MIRVVLDTNVLVSALLSEQGPPGLILELVLAGALQPVFDRRILAEYREVVARAELRLSTHAVGRVLRFVEEQGLLVVAPPWPHPLPDGDDEPFLGAARSGEAAGLVTGNSRHFPKHLREEVRVWSPRDFLGWLREQR